MVPTDVELALSLSWKLLATTVLIVLTARVARSFGPFMTSIMITIPLNAGPGFFFIALEQPAAFISQGALFAFAAAGPVLVFMAVYAQAARFGGFGFCLLLASLAWWLPGLLLSQIELTLPRAFAMIAAGALFARLSRRRMDLFQLPKISPPDWPALILRGLAGGIAVAGVASFNAWLGPDMSGLLLGFPTIVTASVWVLHRRYGGEFAAATLTSGQRSLVTYASFCLLLHLLAGPLPAVSAVLTAFALAVCLAALLAWLVWRAMQRTRAKASAATSVPPSST